MPRLIRAARSPILALAPALALVLVQPGVAPAQSVVAVRPTGPHLTAQMIEAVADAAPPIRLTQEKYPDASALSFREVIQALCGRISNDYLAVLKSRTGLTEADLDQKPNPRIYDADIPNCLYVSPVSETRRYAVREGDTFSTVRERFTGVQGSIVGNARFFSLPIGVIKSGALSPGQSLKIPYFTAATVLPKDDAATLLDAIAPPKGKTTQDFVNDVSAPIGRIVTHVRKEDGTPETPADCGVAPVAPFDAEAVAEAFERSKRRAVDRNLRFPNFVDVTVADNGFFGARPKAGGGYEFRTPEFDARYFETVQYGGQLGPAILNPPNQSYPVNYQNSVSPGGAVPGHGTHVTGLILGGKTFLDQRARVFDSGGAAFLKITQINLGRGSDTLLIGSNKELAYQLLLTTGSRIVNLSVTYDGAAPGVSESFLYMDETQKPKGSGDHLYVVAAGNDTGLNASKFQPAARGGPGVGTVITVAALTPAGRLASFSNIGGSAVDLAAPGCNSVSWTGFTGEPQPLSGTSQATPTVTFELVLIRALTGATGAELKLRALASGDLLDPNDVKKVGGHLKINIPRAMHVFDDYVRWGPPGTERAVLGTVVKASGFSCDDGTSLDLKELSALKRDAANFYLYRRPSASTRLIACAAETPAAGGVVVVKPDVEAVAGYPASPESSKAGPERLITIPANDVRDITMRLTKID